MSGAGCLICGAPLHFWFARRDREVFRCGRCGHIQVPAGLLVGADGRSIYESDDPIFEADGNAEYYMDQGTADAAAVKLRFLRRFLQGRDKVILDVGAGFGHFVAAASTELRAIGVELSPAAVQWSVEHFGVDSHVGSLYDLPASVPAKVDAITMWDVIEHVEDPRRALSVLRDRLASGGWLFLSSPDAGSLVARLLGRRWYYEDPVQHIHLFSTRNLHRLLREAGFRVASTHYLGRRYRVNYVLNRLRYLAGAGVSARALDLLLRLPASIRRRHVAIKLWDVMAVAAQRTS